MDNARLDLTAYGVPDVEDNSNETGAANVLFAGDTGDIPLDTRRALMQLLAGPFVSGRKHSKLWTALMRDERVIRGRLSELFLDVVIDRDQQVAFVRQCDSQGVEAPTLLRRSQLTFIDSALILHLRRRLTTADASGERAVVSETEIIEHLSVYERAASTDRAGFIKRVKSSIQKCKKNNILQLLRATKDRFEISPTLKLLFSAEEIIALTNLYVEIAGADGSMVHKRSNKRVDSDEEEPGDDDDEW